MTNRYQAILSAAVKDYCARHRPGYIAGCFSGLFHSFKVTTAMKALIDKVDADDVNNKDARTLITNFLKKPDTRKRDLSFASILLDHLITHDPDNRKTWEAEVPRESKVIFYASSPEESLYRGIDWDPRPAFNKGMACRPIGSVDEALSGGGLMNRAGISTTKSYSIARSYATSSWQQPTAKGCNYTPHNSSYVLKIDLKDIIAIDHDATTATRTGKVVGPSLQEVKVIETIPAHCIVGAWHIHAKGEPTWIPNPNYRPTLRSIHEAEEIVTTPAKLRCAFAS